MLNKKCNNSVKTSNKLIPNDPKEMVDATELSPNNRIFTAHFRKLLSLHAARPSNVTAVHNIEKIELIYGNFFVRKVNFQLKK